MSQIRWETGAQSIAENRRQGEGYQQECSSFVLIGHGLVHGQASGHDERTMHLKILLLAPICVALATPPLFAQTQMEMTSEAGNKLTLAEQRMDKVYTDLKAKISADSGKMLETAQQTWCRFRDEECTFETRGSVGGSVNHMMLYGCQTGLTNERITRLERQLNCEEGDMGCARR